jgi:IclR family acetate operon transcriptional repressor
MARSAAQRKCFPPYEKRKPTLDQIDAPTTPRRRGRPASANGEHGDVQSLDRAVSLLELLANGEGLVLSDLARRAGLPPSTAHRLLMTLYRRGLVGHEGDAGLWTVGPGLFRIGSAYLRIRKLPDIARPIIRALLAEVEETVNVSMLDGSELVCVAQAESHAPVRAFFRMGRRLPIHASGAGKAILAAGDEALHARLLGVPPYERFTHNTRRTRAALAKDLQATRARGWAIDDEEHTLGMRCVSAVVVNEFAEPAGAVSISAPTVRMPSDRLLELGGKVQGAAATLSSLYSGQQAR